MGLDIAAESIRSLASNNLTLDKMSVLQLNQPVNTRRRLLTALVQLVKETLKATMGPLQRLKKHQFHTQEQHQSIKSRGFGLSFAVV